MLFRNGRVRRVHRRLSGVCFLGGGIVVRLSGGFGLLRLRQGGLCVRQRLLGRFGIRLRLRQGGLGVFKVLNQELQLRACFSQSLFLCFQRIRFILQKSLLLREIV